MSYSCKRMIHNMRKELFVKELYCLQDKLRTSISKSSYKLGISLTFHIDVYFLFLCAYNRNRCSSFRF